MNIALDYDGTFTRAPDLWRRTSAQFRAAGHKVYIVTLRSPSELDEVRKEAGPWVDGVIPCSRKSKREGVRDAGILIHIWIDDMPETIAMGDAGVVLA